MTIQYTQSASKITLKSVLNQFPSLNNLTLTLMTNLSETIEVSSQKITPIIALDPLQFSGVSNSSSVGSSVQLDLIITST
jgi:hypothetical protein